MFGNHRMKQHLIDRLETDFPVTLAGWENLLHHGASRIVNSDGFEFEALSLCRDYGIIQCRPAILFRICQRYSKVSTHHIYPYISVHDVQDQSSTGFLRANGQAITLHPDDQFIVEVGRAKLDAKLQAVQLETLAASAIPSSSCTSFATCTLLTEAFTSTLQLNVIDPLRFIALHDTLQQQLCNWCERNVRGLVGEVMDTVWMDLPTVFGLRSWDNICRKDLQTELNEM